MSNATLHTEWLSLVDISGTFLTLEVLRREFPYGLNTLPPAQRDTLAAAYGAWRTDPHASQADWVGAVLGGLLQYPASVLTMQPTMAAAPTGAAQALRAPMPYALMHEPDTPEQPHLLICTHPPNTPHAAAIESMCVLLHTLEIPLGLLSDGEAWTLLYAVPHEPPRFMTWYAARWFSAPVTLQAFVSLLGIYRFFGVPPQRTLAGLAAECADAAHRIGEPFDDPLRRALALLIDAMVSQEDAALWDDADLQQRQEAALTLMMRLVFVLAAEAHDLLPLRQAVYAQDYALSPLRIQLQAEAAQYGEAALVGRFDAWARVLALFRAIYGGVRQAGLRLPPYGGHLFDPDRFPFLEGRTSVTHWRSAPARAVLLDDAALLRLLNLLEAVRVDVQSQQAPTPALSAAAQSAVQMGYIYERLLDYEVCRAQDYMLGFSGGKNLAPEIALGTLEALSTPSEQERFISDKTMRALQTIRNGLNTTPSALQIRHLRAACLADETLCARVLPYLNLLRQDENGSPFLVFPAQIYVALGTSRRVSGAYYTPAPFAWEMVQHTLAPQVMQTGALKAPADLLALRVCDIAMGSGVFLVAAVEYLAGCLLQAWDAAWRALPDVPAITVEGNLPQGAAREQLIWRDDPANTALLAKRLVAARCVYGVDKNSLAVEMGKLALWLTTADSAQPFAFLDAKLKVGDALVGVTLAQLRAGHLSAQRTAPLRMGVLLQPIIDTVRAPLSEDTQSALRTLTTAANHLVAKFWGKSTQSTQARLLHTLKALSGAEPLPAVLEAHPLPAPPRLPFVPFHWELTFAEVFLRGGFDAIVSNPPFMGGQKISGAMGATYRDYLVNVLAGGRKGSADLCAYFFLRAYALLKDGGTMGLVATNTIAQGDTRTVGLEQLVRMGGTLFRAVNHQAWDGATAVAVSVVHVYKGAFDGQRWLDGAPVTRISPMLDSTSPMRAPCPLAANAKTGFQGSIVLGMGFVLSVDEARALMEKDARNREVLFPYVNGQDFNRDPSQRASRWVINFFDWTEARAMQYPDCYAILKEKVYPERITQKRALRQRYWWRYGEMASALYATIAPLRRVLVVPLVSKYVNFAFLPMGWVYAHRLGVFADERARTFAVLQSSLHEIWARKYSSTLETRMDYSLTDAFETFPFPQGGAFAALDAIGEQYHQRRHDIMQHRQAGLTATYNRLHDPTETDADIEALRAQHAHMDRQVVAAYGWQDLSLDHDFYETEQGIRFGVSEPVRLALLSRLLQLNHARYAQECREGRHKSEGCAAFLSQHDDMP